MQACTNSCSLYMKRYFCIQPYGFKRVDIYHDPTFERMVGTG
jgi:hypothetical protein